jgi:transposase-like protein
MPRAKLSDAERQELIRLYQTTDATAITLAEKFDISVSTATRMLKANLPEAEYQELSKGKRKRGVETRGTTTVAVEVAPEVPTEPVEIVSESAAAEPIPAEVPEVATEPLVTPTRSTRPPRISRARAAANAAAEKAAAEKAELLDSIPVSTEGHDPQPEISALEYFAQGSEVQEQGNIDTSPVDVQAFEDIELPRVCYIVVDRASELVARPLRDFRQLGTMSALDADALAIPVFDNHRWARKFSNRFQRILKVPSYLLDITRHYLVDRGITRAIMGKKVYSLEREGVSGNQVMTMVSDEEELLYTTASFGDLDDFNESDDSNDDDAAFEDE